MKITIFRIFLLMLAVPISLMLSTAMTPLPSSKITTTTSSKEKKVIAEQGTFTFKNVPKNRKAVSLHDKDQIHKIEEFPLTDKGFLWDENDAKTFKWRTQGITGVKESGQEFVFVSWTGRAEDDQPIGSDRKGYTNRGARISIVDITNMENIPYRHVLLTYKDEATGEYKTFPKLKAGGIMYLDGKIHVTDSRKGDYWAVRVFDMNKIIDLTEDKKLYKYQYIVAEEYSYKTPISPSCMSYDRDRKQIIMGQFSEKASQAKPNIFTMFSPPKNATEAALFNTSTVSNVPIYRLPDNYSKIQGIASSTDLNGRHIIWLSTSHGKDSRSNLYRFNVEINGSTPRFPNIINTVNKNTEKYPPGLQDAYFSSSDQLWLLTNYAYEEGKYMPLYVPSGTDYLNYSINPLNSMEKTRRGVFAINKVDIAAPKVTINHHEDKDWVNGFPIVKFDDITYNRKGEAGTKDIAGYNIPKEKQPQNAPHAFKWDKFDSNDWRWWPQGVSGNSNSDLGGQKRLLMTSWYDSEAKTDLDAIDLASNAADGKIKKSFKNFEASVTVNNQGARITITDISDPNNIQYRHILLVESTNRKYTATNKLKGKKQKFYDDFAKNGDNKYTPIITHAGGVSWYKNYAYLADGEMIRVFDLNKIFKTEGKQANGETNNQCGFIDGKYHAFNYTYAVPQVAVYHIEGTGKHSCISLENINGKRKLWSATFQSRLETGDDFKSWYVGFKLFMPRKTSKHLFTDIYGYDLNEDGTISQAPASVETYTFKYAQIRNTGLQAATIISSGFSADVLDINSVNGVYRQGDKTYFTRNMAPRYESSLGRMVVKEDNSPAIMYRWPHTSEDFYYEKDTDILWSCTETPYGHYYLAPIVDKAADKSAGNRVMFGIKMSSYKTK